MIFLCCAVGLLVGIVAADLMDSSLISLVRRGMDDPVSTVWSGLQILFLFLITAMAVKIDAFPILLATGFLTSMRYGASVWIAFRAYGTAAWLVQPLVQFSGNFLMAGYWFFLFRYGMGRTIGRSVWGFAAGFAVLVTIIDHLVVRPFWGMLIG